ncbi:hypothetical protein DEO72_LG8g1561 [Vigna unguiculata]|uniref:Myb/SANT-like domain-containing protein n=1 Tax=Vigna unguiculata TaxID=3917 RepID=A0A4D6MPY7_VIGUN|nr:hypothetical protein DEO72_LG8g1561 [Vigna unguiculata]
MTGKFRLGESLLPCKVEEDHQPQRGFMAGINVTYQPVVLEANQRPGLARAEGPPGMPSKVYQTRCSSDKEKPKYMRDPDLAIVSEVHHDGNQTKSLRWTVEMDHWLGKILVDQVKKGLKVDKVLLTEAYESAVSVVNAKFGLHLEKFNIKNRLKTWKKQYEQLKEILSHTGFQWDKIKKMIIANDSTWNDYIRVTCGNSL